MKQCQKQKRQKTIPSPKVDNPRLRVQFVHSCPIRGRWTVDMANASPSARTHPPASAIRPSNQSALSGIRTNSTVRLRPCGFIPVRCPFARIIRAFVTHSWTVDGEHPTLGTDTPTCPATRPTNQSALSGLRTDSTVRLRPCGLIPVRLPICEYNSCIRAPFVDGGRRTPHPRHEHAHLPRNETDQPVRFERASHR